MCYRKIKKYFNALVLSLKIMEEEGVKIGDELDHAHIYEKGGDIFILFHLYDNQINFWIKNGEVEKNWEKVRNRNVLFRVKGGKLVKRIIGLGEEEMRRGKYAIEGEEIGLKDEVYVDIGEFDPKVKHRIFKYRNVPIAFYL